MKNLTHAVKTIRVNAPVAAGTTDIETDIVDTSGFDTVRWVVGFGTITSGAVTSIKVQQNTVNSATGMADLEGTGVTVADTGDNTLYIVEVTRPRERYVRLYIDRGTQNAVVDFVIAELGLPKTMPVAQDTTVTSQEVSASPAEGTA